MERIKTLVSMTDFVQHVKEINWYDEDKLEWIYSYSNFLSRPLELSLFIPVDANGNPTEDISNEGSFAAAYYNEAKSKVLFQGFTPCLINGKQCAEHSKYSIYWNLNDGSKIENISSMDIDLSESALKQIYGI